MRAETHIPNKIKVNFIKLVACGDQKFDPYTNYSRRNWLVPVRRFMRFRHFQGNRK